MNRVCLTWTCFIEEKEPTGELLLCPWLLPFVLVLWNVCLIVTWCRMWSGPPQPEPFRSRLYSVLVGFNLLRFLVVPKWRGVFKVELCPQDLASIHLGWKLIAHGAALITPATLQQALLVWVCSIQLQYLRHALPKRESVIKNCHVFIHLHKDGKREKRFERLYKSTSPDGDMLGLWLHGLWVSSQWFTPPPRGQAVSLPLYQAVSFPFPLITDWYLCHVKTLNIV